MHRPRVTPPSRVRLLTIAAPLLLALAVACGKSTPATPSVSPTASATPAPTATATPVPTPTPVPPPPRPDANPFPPDLAARAQGIFDAVSQLRGTPAKAPLDLFLISRAQALAFYSEPAPDSSAPTVTTPTIDPKDALYRLLGMVPDTPAAPSVAQQATDNLISLITAFYSPEYKAMYMLDEIIGGVTGGTATATLAHEYVHALQDQYYDLDALALAREDDWDAGRALEDVTEGDAVHFETAYAGYNVRSTYRVPVCFQIPQPQRSVPFAIERELDTWYEDGLCFFNAVLPQVPNGATSIWEDLPTTTEQILHPEKYLAHEAAKPVLLPPLQTTLGGGWQDIASNDLGEFELQDLLLVGLNDRPLVQRAAAGWGGDAFTLYADGDQRLAQVGIVWDNADEADEFWPAFVQSLASRPGASVEQRGDDAIAVMVGDKLWRASLSGDRVDFVVSNNAAALTKAATALGLP